MNNQLKTFLLLGALSALLVAIGGAIGGGALPVFLTLALVMNFGAYLFSDAIVLRISGARVIDAAEAPALHGMVRELATAAGLPMPRVAVVSDPSPNAFATGRNPSRAVIAVTEGLLQLTSPRELRGVLAHELAHVANRDTLVATIAAAGAAAITYAAHALQWGALLGHPRHEDEGEGHGAGSGLLLAFLAPIAAVMLQMGISRSREYMADEFAARLTRDPEGLASALARLQSHGERLLAHGMAPQPSTTASLSIVNPLSGGGLFRWFATHPPIADRINRLRAMALGRAA